MNVFVTGGTGWIGSAAVDELLKAGHKVVGLVRSDASATLLEAKGVKVLRGELDDLESLRRGATEAEAVIHLANKHDFANPAESDRAERIAVETLADTLVGTQKPFLVASGMSGLYQGQPIIETDRSPAITPESHRGGAENLALKYVSRGVRTIIIRFAPTVHGAGDWGFINFLVKAARKQGVSGYIGDGSHAWSAVHRSDAARLICLGIEKAPAGSCLHAIAEEAISTRSIAEAIGSKLDLPVVTIAPEDAVTHFGFVGNFFKLPMNGSSKFTRELLAWEPTGPSLIDDILADAYEEA